MAQRKGFRAAHGKARELGRLAVTECPPADELPAASPEHPGRSDRTPDGRFAPGNRLARLAKHRAGVRGVLATLDAEADPNWQAARRWGQRAAGHRVTELAKMHGGELSAGVCALVSDEWELRADARYLAAKARASGDSDLTRTAATLLAQARQCARDCWHLAALESAARPKDRAAAAPWLLAPPVRPAGEPSEAGATRDTADAKAAPAGDSEAGPTDADQGANSNNPAPDDPAGNTLNKETTS